MVRRGLTAKFFEDRLFYASPDLFFPFTFLVPGLPTVRNVFKSLKKYEASVIICLKKCKIKCYHKLKTFVYSLATRIKTETRCGASVSEFNKLLEKKSRGASIAITGSYASLRVT